MKKQNKKTFKVIKVTNGKTGLIYYGSTCGRVKGWWANIIQAAMQGYCPASKINAAIRQYGRDDFTVEVVDEDQDFIFVRNTLVPSYIAADNTYRNGLNATTGALGTPRLRFTNKQRVRCAKAARKRVARGDAFGDWNASETKWVTNGFYNRRIHVNSRIPFGFHLGKVHGVKFRRK